ncbi:MAG TPA: DUF2178 domain-containing protein [Candidatus Woesebacteria bacterium]|nr:DUF2178 domain-containing protein [Candidatus Woesebacteria bacterium]
MDRKRFRQVRVFVILFVGVIVSLAVENDSYLLATAGVFTGMLLMALARSKTKINTDEREATVQEKAAKTAYGIFTSAIGIAAFLLLLPTKGGLSVFSKGEWAYIESLGIIFAYLTLLLITIYSVSYFLLNKQYGGGIDEE